MSFLIGQDNQYLDTDSLLDADDYTRLQVISILLGDSIDIFTDRLLDEPFPVTIVPEAEREQNQHTGETEYRNPLNSEQNPEIPF
jgi:hypothetical protein